MANRYWVGGSGVWADGLHWASSSGGVAGASVPTSSDNVYFDVNSFTGVGQIVDFDQLLNCADMDWTGALYHPTIRSSYMYTPTIRVYGSLTFIANMSVVTASTLYLDMRSLGVSTLRCNMLDLSNVRVSFNGTGMYTLLDDITCSEFNMLSGTINTNSKTINCVYFWGSGSILRTINLGSSIIYCSKDIRFDMSTNLTLNVGTSTIVVTGVSLYAGAGLVFNDIEVHGSLTFFYSGVHTCNKLTLYPNSTLKISPSATVVFNDLIADSTLANPISIQGYPIATMSKPSGVVHVYGCVITSIVATGGAAFIAEDSTSGGSNTGWSFPCYGIVDLHCIDNLTVNNLVCAIGILSDEVLFGADHSLNQVLRVLKQGYTYYPDGVTPIKYQWVSAELTVGEPEKYKLFKNIFLELEGVVDSQVLDMALIVDDVEYVVTAEDVTIPAGLGVYHALRLIPPIYGAVLGRKLAIALSSNVGVRSIVVEYAFRSDIPPGGVL